MCYSMTYNLTGFEASRRLWSGSTGFWNRAVSWHLTENENDVTYSTRQQECICAVAIALQSWCLIKLSHGLLLQNFDLALEVVSNGAFAEIVGEWLETAEYALYSSDSSPASCWIKLSCLPSSLWSPFQGDDEHCTSFALRGNISTPEIGALSSSVLAVNV